MGDKAGMSGPGVHLKPGERVIDVAPGEGGYSSILFRPFTCIGKVKVWTRHLLKRFHRGLNIDFPEDVLGVNASTFRKSHT